jgi:hypothetical protein
VVKLGLLKAVNWKLTEEPCRFIKFRFFFILIGVSIWNSFRNLFFVQSYHVRIMQHSILKCTGIKFKLCLYRIVFHARYCRRTKGNAVVKSEGNCSSRSLFFFQPLMKPIKNLSLTLWFCYVLFMSSTVLLFKVTYCIFQLRMSKTFWIILYV